MIRLSYIFIILGLIQLAILGCSGNTSRINYKYGYCPQNTYQENNYQAESKVKDKSFIKVGFEKSSLSEGLYEYQGSEIILKAGEGDGLVLIRAKEEWVTPKNSDEKVLNQGIVCIRGAQNFKKSGFNLNFSGMTKVEIDKIQLKAKDSRLFNIVFDPEASEDEERMYMLTEMEEEPKEVRSPKQYYEDVKYNFFRNGPEGAVKYELRAEFEKDGFLVTHIIRYQFKKP